MAIALSTGLLATSAAATAGRDAGSAPHDSALEIWRVSQSIALLSDI